DPGSQLLVSEKYRGLDRHHHASLKCVGASAEQMEGFAPGRRKTRCQTVAGRMNTAPLEASLHDHPLRGFVRHHRGDSRANLRDTVISSPTDDLIQLAHARRRRTEAELPADCGRVALAGGAVFNAAEITSPQASLRGRSVTETRTLS